MRFFVSPGPRPRPPVRLFLGSSALLLGALVAQRVVEGELTPTGVLTRYLGSGDPSEEMPLTALVESLHAGAFVYGFLLLMVGSLLVTTTVPDRVRLVLTFGAAAWCTLDLFAPLLIVRAHDGAVLRVLAFGCAVTFLGAALVVIALAPERRSP